MPTVPDEPDVTATAHRRIVWTVSAAVLLPVVLMLIGGTGHPELGFVVIALVFPTLWVIGQIRGRRTREGTDERALDMHRRAATFSWHAMAVVLMAMTAWTAFRHGTHTAEPYLVLAVALVSSYLAALLWRRWRGF